MAKQAYSSVTVRLVYDYNANTVYFDGIQLFREQFGTSYTYDEDGNVKSVVDLQKQKTQYEYTDNNLTKIIEPGGEITKYNYDTYNNVTSAITKTGQVYFFTYDDWGNNTSVSVTYTNASQSDAPQNDVNSKKITTYAEYSTDGNYLRSAWDALGNETIYNYNADTGLLEWVQYPEDTYQTRTNYTYDTMYRMASAAVITDTQLGLTVDYTYEDDLLTQLETGSTIYHFTYGDFALRSEVKVGSRSLATYHYHDETINDGKNDLDRLVYGNQDVIQYEYDNQGRTTKQTYEDGAYVSYQYNNSGNLAVMTDSATGIKTTYYYDLTDRMVKYVEKANGYSHSVEYRYDSENNLTTLVETVNGIECETSYTYDDHNRVISTTTDGTTVEYIYDFYGRVITQFTKNGAATVMTESYTYVDPTNATTSTQIATYTVSANGYSETYTYTYDDNGNITSIATDNALLSYEYDSANQLIRENNSPDEFVHVWQYDGAGNIRNRTDYDYTTGSLDGMEPLSTVNYTYNDDDWGDLLTNYNGQSISYDNVGNPTYDGTWNYNWQHGRQLTSMSNEEETWTYTYNADGLRTKRTNGTTTYEYVYDGSLLTQMTVGGHTLRFTYDAAGIPLTVTIDDDRYYYVTNVQGDVVGLLNSSGQMEQLYEYDAWGDHRYVNNEDSLLTLNPLRYRGYVYDTETKLYYLQSRYYNPEIGRFINVDTFVSTGQGVLGYNMFAYCLNNPVNMADTTGELPFFLVTAAIGAVAGAIIGGVVAAKNGGNVWAGIGIGAAVGGLAGAGFGAAAGVMLTGSATASTAAVMMGAATLNATVATGGLGAGAAYIANNILGNPTYTDPVLYAGGDAALKAAESYATTSGGTVIGDTIIGKTADYLASQTPTLLHKFIWQGASELFCHQATGNAYAFISNGAFDVSKSIFWNYEIPVLINKVGYIAEIIIEVF